MQMILKLMWRLWSASRRRESQIGQVFFFFHVLMVLPVLPVLPCSHMNWSHPWDERLESLHMAWKGMTNADADAYSSIFSMNSAAATSPQAASANGKFLSRELLSHVATVSSRSGWILHIRKWLHLASHDLISELSDTLWDDLQVYIDKAFEDPHWLLDCTSDDTMWNIHIIHIIIHMNLQELVLFCLCRSSKLPKTQPVSWPKCWNCEPKIVSILITCAFWKFHLHSCAVYVILHDTSIYFWYLMFFGCIGPSLIVASHKQQTGNQIWWCFSTLLGNISHQITALPHCHQTQKQDSKTVYS